MTGDCRFYALLKGKVVTVNEAACETHLPGHTARHLQAAHPLGEVGVARVAVRR